MLKMGFFVFSHILKRTHTHTLHTHTHTRTHTHITHTRTHPHHTPHTHACRWTEVSVVDYMGDVFLIADTVLSFWVGFVKSGSVVLNLKVCV